MFTSIRFRLMVAAFAVSTVTMLPAMNYENITARIKGSRTLEDYGNKAARKLKNAGKKVTFNEKQNQYIQPEANSTQQNNSQIEPEPAAPTWWSRFKTPLIISKLGLLVLGIFYFGTN